MSSSAHLLPDGPDVRRPASERVTWGWLLVISAAYLVVAAVCARTLVIGDRVSAFCPAGGLAAGALAVANRRRWLLVAAIAATTLPAHVTLIDAAPARVALAAGTATEAMVFAYALVHLWPRARELDRRASVLQFFGAAVVAAAAASTVATAGLVAAGMLSGPAGSMWAIGTESHVLGILTVAPIVLLGGRLRRLGARRLTELACFVALLAVAARAGFDPAVPTMLPYVPLAVLLFSVVWLGTPGAATLPAVLVPVAVLETISGHGPFAVMPGTETHHVLAAQLYGLFAVVAAWLIAAMLAEHASSADGLRDSNRELDTRVTERTAALAREKQHAELGARISEALGEARLDEHATMKTIAGRLADGLGDACVVLHLVDDGTALAPLVVGARDDDVAKQLEATFATMRFDATAAGLTGRAIQTGTAVRTSGTPESLAREAHPGLRDAALLLGIHSAAVAPMHCDGEIVGALIMLRQATPEGYDDTEAALLQDFANRAGLALGNARLHAVLAAQALHDPLTGLANRDLAMDHLHLALDGLERRNDAVAVLYVDLDRFKDVNDTLGHDAGDEVLHEVAARLRATVRAPDTAARVGGDEFVIVCPGIDDPRDAVRIAQRVDAALSVPIRVADTDLDVGASIGVTTTTSARADAETLIMQADQAMYEAKKQGRRRFQMYDTTIRQRAFERLLVEQDLRRAIEDDWLRLHYQPVVDLETGLVVGLEALLRIDHPLHGLLTPPAFIDVAEDSDLIVPIGEWVVAEACRQLARWSGLAELDVAVNVSGRQVTTGVLGAQVLAATDAAGIDPGRLILEMTERVLIDVAGERLDDLHRLTGQGVRLAIDDFGTGYSSLTYLKNMPVDIVKIDRSFTAGLGVDESDRAIVEAVTTLARTLGLGTVAEGVEDATQRETLHRLGCQHAQGFYFARPLPPDDIERRLHAPCAPRRASRGRGYRMIPSAS